MLDYYFYLKTNDENLKHLLKPGISTDANLVDDNFFCNLDPAIFPFMFTDNVYKYEGLYKIKSIVHLVPDTLNINTKPIDVKQIFCNSMAPFNKDIKNHFVDFKKFSGLGVRKAEKL